MTEEWAGHHCEVCYKRYLKDRQDAEYRRQYAREIADAENKARAIEISNRAHQEAAFRRYEESQRRNNLSPANHQGYIFAKSCRLPDGITNYLDPQGFVPTDMLKEYGAWAVLGTAAPLAAGGTSLNLIGGSVSAKTLATRLGGQLSLGTIAGAAMGTTVGTLLMLLPNRTSQDSAFYTDEQFATLTVANTRVRLNIKRLQDGTIDAYGFYTGTNPSWQNVRVIKATPRASQFVADLGQGVELIWTPTVDPSTVLGIPALEGAPTLPILWVYPPSEAVKQILVNPVYPPDYQDAIIWFPADTGLQPIYISLSVAGDHHYHPAPKTLSAFPDALPVKAKNTVQGGHARRKRWKDSKGRIYEWDARHGTVELYDRQGRHLGEFDPETGKRTKPPQADRNTPK